MTTTAQDFTPSLTQKLALALYTIILSVIIAMAFLIFVIKSPFGDKKYRARQLQRFGFLPKAHKHGGILLHCVSVGEVVAASAIVKRIQTSRPDFPIVITTTTATGAERVAQIFADQISKGNVKHLYLPYDLPHAMQALIKRIRPEKVLITEVELWPNLIDVCWRTNIPVYIVNARLTDKSASSYAKMPLLFDAMMQKLGGICAQGERDYNNYQGTVLPNDKLVLTNNIKFDHPLTDKDRETAESIKQQLNTGDRPVLLGASTHAPEEEILLESYKGLREQYPELLLVITPRHPERFGKVEKRVTDTGMNLHKFSTGQAVNAYTDVVLIDAMGILKSLYSIATIAFVGGSIADRGGHNALEAALFAKPILMGPHTYNNPVICQTLIDAGALTIVNNSAELSEKVAYWLAHPQAAETAGKGGITVLQDNAGAIDKTLNIVGIDA